VRDRVWHDGEEAAWQSYRERGYRLLARNWKCPIGELDLVLSRGGEVVFCEVKSRRPSAFGGPFEAVGRDKRRKLRTLAQTYCATEHVHARTYRFDVASVTIGPGGADVYVFEDAF
jgi:putative endonuclease